MGDIISIGDGELKRQCRLCGRIADPTKMVSDAQGYFICSREDFEGCRYGADR